MATMAEAERADGYAQEPPAEPWEYVIDDTRTIYRRGLVAQKLRRGWWPFADEDPEREQASRHPLGRPNVAQECGAKIVRLAPDCKFWSWRNEYVLAGPDREVPHLAHASLDIWVRRAVTVHIQVHLDLRAGTFTVEGLPEDAPAEVIERAGVRGRKLAAFFAAECAARDSDKPRPVTAADLEHERRAKQIEQIRAGCERAGLKFKPCEYADDHVWVGGERMPLYFAARKVAA